MVRRTIPRPSFAPARFLAPLEDGGYALSAADAHGLQAELGVAPLHLVQQCGEYAASGRGYGVPQGYA